MDPLTVGLAGGSIISSLYGMYQQGQSADKAAADMEKAVQAYLSVHVPDPAQQKLELERFQLTGQLSPKLEHAIKADPSAFEEIVKNQKYSQAQDQALSQLQSLGEEGGLSLSDKADLQEQMMLNANKDKANRDAITDEMSRRGQGGSGMELQAQLSGAQSAGDRDAQSRLRTLGSARDRALSSIMGAGELAGKLESQDYQQKSDLASARDRINSFNTENARSVHQRNTGTQNDAEASNLAMRQRVSDSNTDLANREQQYNKELYQKEYDNKMQKASGVAGAYGASAAGTRQAGAQTAQQYGAIGSAVGQVGSTIQNQNNWDDWLESAKKKKTSSMAGSSYTDTSGYA